MLGVAAWPHGFVAILTDEATLFRELRTSGDARPGRILRAVPQVMSLWAEHDSNSDSIVSHSHDGAHLLRRLGGLDTGINRCRRSQVQRLVIRRLLPMPAA